MLIYFNVYLYRRNSPHSQQTAALAFHFKMNAAVAIVLVLKGEPEPVCSHQQSLCFTQIP